MRANQDRAPRTVTRPAGGVDAHGGRVGPFGPLHDRIRQLEQELEAASQSRAQLESALDADLFARHGQEETRKDAYRQLVRRVARAAGSALPPRANVLVISKGDDQLLALDGPTGWHFPQNERGVYAGYYPVDSTAAIDHLESLRDRSAQYLLIPSTARWWLDHYERFARHLETRYEAIVRDDDTCLIYSLRAPTRAAGLDAYDALATAVGSFEAAFGRQPAILDWGSGLRLQDHATSGIVFEPPGQDATLPYLDGTIDMVAYRPTQVDGAEARRVASAALVIVESTDEDGADAAPCVEVTWLARDVGRTQDASIVIPCHNHADLTDACLTALSATLPRDFSGEIIVMDDGSTDATPRVLRRWARRDRRIRVMRRKSSRGFIAACNRAAKAATRDVLVFLNNDTEPRRGWLTALLRTFAERPDAGVVGGQLVLPDGTLQEAGGVIFNDGSAANFGRGERDLEAPWINYVRSVDYCSGALLATRRSLFADLGGFDMRYAPAYYEDVDYCFRVRDVGQGVYYQPASRVMHREGASCGTDLAHGVKRFQAANQLVFAERWAQAIGRQPPRPPDGDVAAWRALAVWQASTPT